LILIYSWVFPVQSSLGNFALVYISGTKPDQNTDVLAGIDDKLSFIVYYQPLNVQEKGTRCWAIKVCEISQKLILKN
jgi:hypothetical protein